MKNLRCDRRSHMWRAWRRWRSNVSPTSKDQHRQTQTNPSAEIASVSLVTANQTRDQNPARFKLPRDLYDGAKVQGSAPRQPRTPTRPARNYRMTGLHPSADHRMLPNALVSRKKACRFGPFSLRTCAGERKRGSRMRTRSFSVGRR